MSHFECGEWVDYIRGLVSEQDRLAMRAHLLSPCQKCGKTVESLRKLAVILGEENRYEVPAHVIRGVRAVYGLQQPERVYVLPRIVGRLVYDSFRQPLPAGLRSRHRLSRQALYKAAHYSLDLRLERHHGGGGVTLVGQVANERDPARPPADLPVFLMSGKRIVARTFSNAYGEFQLNYQPARHLRLYVQANQELGKHIEVPMSRFNIEAPALKQVSHQPNRKSD